MLNYLHPFYNDLCMIPRIWLGLHFLRSFLISGGDLLFTDTLPDNRFCLVFWRTPCALSAIYSPTGNPFPFKIIALLGKPCYITIMQLGLSSALFCLFHARQRIFASILPLFFFKTTTPSRISFLPNLSGPSIRSHSSLKNPFFY